MFNVQNANWLISFLIIVCPLLQDTWFIQHSMCDMIYQVSQTHIIKGSFTNCLEPNLQHNMIAVY